MRRNLINGGLEKRLKIKNRGESKFIRQLKIATLTQPNTAKYVNSTNLLKRTGTGYQIFEHYLIRCLCDLYSETIFKSNNFSMSLGKHCNEA